jgi:hypothetical protein
MAELTAEEARRLSRIVPSVPIEKYTHSIDNAIREAAGKGHFEIYPWQCSIGAKGTIEHCLERSSLAEEEVRAIIFHYENKGFNFVLRPNGGGVLSAFDLETVLTWKEVREMPEPAESTESNDATSDREALVEYLGSIKIND